MICSRIQTEIMQSGVIPFTEYEEEISFDVDDPDFKQVGCSPSPTSHRSQAQQKSCSVQARAPPLSDGNLNRSLSFDALETNHAEYVVQNDQPVLTIEELRSHLNSCFTCGVSWLEDHVSLDCPECGGYSLQRPCMQCNGQCNSVWQRELSTTHSLGKAKWTGECKLTTQTKEISSLSSTKS